MEATFLLESTCMELTAPGNSDIDESSRKLVTPEGPPRPARGTGIHGQAPGPFEGPVGHSVGPGLRCLGWATLSLGSAIAMLVVAHGVPPDPNFPGWAVALIVAWLGIPAIVLYLFYLTSRLSVSNGRLQLSLFGGLRRRSLERAEAAVMVKLWVWRSTSREGTGTMYRYEIRQRDGSAPIRCSNNLWSDASLEHFASAISLPLEREKPPWPVRLRMVLYYVAPPVIYFAGPIFAFGLLGGTSL